MRTARNLMAAAIFAAAVFGQPSAVSARSCLTFIEECAYYFGCVVQWYMCDESHCWGDCPCDQNPDEVCEVGS